MRLMAPPVSPPPLHVTTPAPTGRPGAVSCPEEMMMILKAANNEQLPPSSFPSVDTSSSVDLPLVTYNVKGDELSAPALSQAPPSLLPYQREFALQRSAWSLFTTLVPLDQRGMLAQFQIMTDGPGGVLSAVEQTPGDPTRWILEADIADMPDQKNFAFTLLHEYGHLLTLNSTQVPPDLRVFNNPDSSRIRQRAAASCSDYFPGEGCSLASSYINTFFDRFWKDLYEEWSAIDQIDDQDRREAKLHGFYRKYNNRFVDLYAASSPVEDIAETWAYFVLTPRPAGQSLADEKMAFFYQYPELVTLRDHVRAGLCAANP